MNYLTIPVGKIKLTADERMSYLIKYLFVTRLAEVCKFKSFLQCFVWTLIYNKGVPIITETVKPLAERLGLQFPIEDSHNLSLFLSYLQLLALSTCVLRKASAALQIDLFNIHRDEERRDPKKLELFKPL